MRTPAALFLLVLLSLASQGGRVTPLPAAAQDTSETVPLVQGCQIVSLAGYAPGTALATVTGGIAPAEARPRLWFHQAADNSFGLYDPASPERSTKTTLEPPDEGAFLCLDAPATWSRPAVAGAVPAAAPVDVQSYRFRGRFEVESTDVDGTSIRLSFDVDGAFVAPDRLYVRTTGNFGGLTVQEESITIGGRSWVRADGSWEEGEPLFGTSDFGPASFARDLDTAALGTLEATRETVDGVPTLHYRISAEDVRTVPGLAALFGGEDALQDLPEDFQFDLWLAEAGRWPVRIEMTASEDSDGGQVAFHLSLDVTGVNDPTIVIEPPI